MLTALVLCRLAHFSATMLLFGASAFLWGLAPAGLARELGAPLRRMLIASINIAAASALVWLGLEAATMGDGVADMINPDALGAVAFDTAFGRLWLARLGLTLVLAGVLMFGRRDRFGLIALLSALLLASLALTGHAAMQVGLGGALHRLNHAIHLIAAGAWLGALPPLILCLRRYRGEATFRVEARATLRRFSGLGHLAVALVVLTGVLNTALTLNAWPTDFSSPYQALLAAKIAVVAAMIALAVVNRYVLTPRLKSEPTVALRALTINSLGEVGLGLIVLALVSAFALLAPV